MRDRQLFGVVVRTLGLGIILVGGHRVFYAFASSVLHFQIVLPPARVSRGWLGLPCSWRGPDVEVGMVCAVRLWHRTLTSDRFPNVITSQALAEISTGGVGKLCSHLRVKTFGNLERFVVHVPS